MNLSVLLSRLFFRRHRATVCGHRTRLIEKVNIYGEEMKLLVSKNHEYCQQCLADMSIKCAWCGQYIRVGDPITLYSPSKDFKVPEHAVVYKKDPLQLVGCLRFNCAISGVDRCGFWQPPGVVDRVLSPLEMVLGQFPSEDVVFCNDLADPLLAIHIKEE